MNLLRRAARRLFGSQWPQQHWLDTLSALHVRLRGQQTELAMLRHENEAGLRRLAQCEHQLQEEAALRLLFEELSQHLLSRDREAADDGYSAEAYRGQLARSIEANLIAQEIASRARWRWARGEYAASILAEAAGVRQEFERRLRGAPVGRAGAP